MGRPPIGRRAMTDAERQRARRKRLLESVPEIPVEVTRHDKRESIRIEIVLSGGDDDTRDKIARHYMKQLNRIGRELR